MEAVETTFTPELLPEEQFLDDEISMWIKISSLRWIEIRLTNADFMVCRYIVRGSYVLHWRLIYVLGGLV